MAEPQTIEFSGPPARGIRGLLKRAFKTLFRIPEGCPVPFGVWWRLGQLVGFNRHVPWPVHFTSTVRAPGGVKLGKATFPGDSPSCYIQAINGIEIGDYTNLGPGVGLISANHDPMHNAQWIKAPPIKLGKHCWLGMHSVVLAGVELGDNTIVGAGAVVTKSFPQGYVVLGGNPARVISELPRPDHSTTQPDGGASGDTDTENGTSNSK